jgi:LuxR family transcriptional regulator, maltose regulon positive regulatory protein
VGQLLERLPPPTHVILTARQEPPLPLARLRARDEINDLRAEDLRFSRTEITAFFQQAVSLALPAETLARLEERTEGWPAGLRLVTLALQGRRDLAEITEFLHFFTGSHRHVLDYLSGEVLAAQPEALQDFLLQTSLLHQLNASLCNAVTGRADSATLLEQIEAANLFLTPLDGARQWYRYHTLFAEAMRHAAQLRLGDVHLRRLAERASRWYEAHDLLAEAVEMALQAAEVNRAADLIQAIIERTQHLQEIHTLRRWIEQLPTPLLQAYPLVAFTYAVALLFTEDRHAQATATLVETALQIAEGVWQREEDEPHLGMVWALRGMVDWWQGERRRACAAARTALTLLPAEKSLWRGSCLISLGIEAWLGGDPQGAHAQLLQARDCFEASGNVYGVLAARLSIGEVQVARGQLQQAAELYEQILAAVAHYKLHNMVDDRAHALSQLALLDMEWNHLDRALGRATEAFAISQQLTGEELRTRTGLALARVHAARHEQAQAQQLLRTLVAQIRLPHLIREIALEQTRLALTVGDQAAVDRWCAEYGPQVGDIPPLQQEREALLLAQIRIEQGQPAAALRLIDRWQPDAHAAGRIYPALELLVLRARAHHLAHNASEAQEALYQALTLAQSEGYVRLFLAQGEAVATLLQTLSPSVRSEPLLGYLRTLLRAFGAEPRPYALTAPAGKDWFLLEPLSAQERRVLRLLAAGLSNPEIAQELVVSINTIKTQVKSIFRKLNVNSREEARLLAHQLSLYS